MNVLNADALAISHAYDISQQCALKIVKFKV